MKKLIMYCLIAISLFTVSCKKDFQPVQNNDDNGPVLGREAGGSSDGTELPTTIATMYASQTINAGSITISNDSNFIYITYNITNGYTLAATHLFVGAAAAIPVNSNGSVQPG